ncbi:ATP-binding protein [Kitasatospora acidiphila]|uniref:ATP-binding protein n=1 Tax=Kitasatospora acidiphila TaxID=2567942 RepID=A0A540W0A7_9ACTN|nr:ATP-binding protein [Kitasatospora acidiphila]TQF02456.1 ATP-binding protein [Kitasatospora acidiphila]
MEREYRPMRDEFHVTVGVEAVRRARERVVAAAEHWGVPLSADALSDVRLCASELVANALEHAGGSCLVTVDWVADELRVEVADGCRRPPAVLVAGDELPSGRGLVLVEALAGRWGWRMVPGGKVVYFAFAAKRAPLGQRGEPVSASAASYRR